MPRVSFAITCAGQLSDHHGWQAKPCRTLWFACRFLDGSGEMSATAEDSAVAVCNQTFPETEDRHHFSDRCCRLVTGPLTTECPTTARKCHWRLSSAVCIRQGTMVAEQSEVLGPQRSFRLGNGNCSRCKGLQVVFRSLQPDLHTARPEATQNVAIASPKTVFEVQIPLD